MAAQAAYLARLIVNGATNMHATRVQVTYRADEFDVTTFENFAIGQYSTGITDFDISFDAFWDPVDNPFTAGPNLLTGSTVSLRVQYSKTVGNNPGWFWPTVIILSSSHEVVVRDVLRYSVTAKAVAFTQANASNITIPAS